MKKFEFRLQRVLEIKEELEKQKERELGEAQKVVLDIIEKIENLNAIHLQCRQELEKKTSEEKVDTIEMQNYYRYLKQIENNIERQLQLKFEAETELERRRVILIEASKERKILENLKERKISLYQEELNRFEQNIIDEIASNKFARGDGELL